jgi:hypothetical protein
LQNNKIKKIIKCNIMNFDLLEEFITIIMDVYIVNKIHIECQKIERKITGFLQRTVITMLM